MPEEHLTLGKVWNHTHDDDYGGLLCDEITTIGWNEWVQLIAREATDCVLWVCCVRMNLSMHEDEIQVWILYDFRNRFLLLMLITYWPKQTYTFSVHALASQDSNWPTENLISLTVWWFFDHRCRSFVGYFHSRSTLYDYRFHFIKLAHAGGPA